MFALLTAAHSSYVLQPSAMAPTARTASRTSAPPTMFWGSIAAADIVGIDARKQQKLIKAAQLFLQKESRWARSPCRFDVVAITSAGQTENLNWIRNAFDS